MNYKWKCKICGCEKIEEVMTGVTQSSSVESIYYDKTSDEIIAEYAEVSTDGGHFETIRYQCIKCGAPVSREELISISSPIEDM